MRVALADGKIIKAGGRVVKNVAGYDLCKLFTGSYGSLAVILEITFKVRPRPQCEAAVVASGPVSSLLQGARAILDQRLFPVALEILSPRLARELHIDTDNDPAVLLARFAGNTKGVAFQTERATDILRSLSEVSKAAVVAEDQTIWTNQLCAIESTTGAHERAFRSGDIDRRHQTVTTCFGMRCAVVVQVIDGGSAKDCAAILQGMKTTASRLDFQTASAGSSTRQWDRSSPGTRGSEAKN
jgi:hypothetical protein